MSRNRNFMISNRTVSEARHSKCIAVFATRGNHPLSSCLHPLFTFCSKLRNFWKPAIVILSLKTKGSNKGYGRCGLGAESTNGFDSALQQGWVCGVNDNGDWVD